ncbi:MAG: sodium:solute symporter family transporter [Candidatus Aminicenantales bacterium]
MGNVQSIVLPDYLVILAYFIVIVAVGLSFAKYIQKAKDYFAAGSMMPWWLAGTSFYKASFSALLFVIYNEIAYKYGIVAIVIMWISPICILLGGYFTAHRWRRSRVVTPLGFMERRYSPTVHQVFVWTGLPLRMFDNSLKILSTSIIFAVALRSLGLGIVSFMAIIGLIMVLYSFLGGQMTVMITDFVNVSILGVAVVTLFIMTLGQIGNFGDFIRQLPPGFLNPAPEPYGWSYLIFTVFLITILTYNASWALVQKYNTLKSEKEVRKMIWWIAFLMFIMPPLFFFPGLAARVLLPGIENAKEVYAIVCLKILPMGLMGFVLSAVISSTMSTLGSEFNTLSGVLTRDFYKKKIKPNLSEKEEVFMGRTFTVVIGALTVLLAILFNSLKGFNLMDIMFRIFSAFGPAIMVPLVFGLLFKRFNARGALWGVVAGSLTGVLLVVVNFFLVQIYVEEMKLNPHLDFWLRSGWNSAATVLSIGATILGMWLGTASRPTTAGEKARRDEFFADLGRPFLFEEREKKALSPFRIIGFMLMTFGLAIAVISVFILLDYQDHRAFRIDLIVAGVLVLLGGLMRLGKKEKPD